MESRKRVLTDKAICRAGIEIQDAEKGLVDTGRGRREWGRRIESRANRYTRPRVKAAAGHMDLSPAP